jgi:hypothetical protein
VIVVRVMVAVSPQLLLMPATMSMLFSSTLSILTWRSYELVQLPQPRYSLPEPLR